jgi:ATP phosphoribosyltransferase
MKKSRLKIALQKKGRLHNDCIDLLLQCGLKIHVKENSLVCHCENLPIDILFIRDDDIPTLISDNICDMGIVGENVLVEEKFSRKKLKKTMNIEVIKKLGFSQCRLSIAVPMKKFSYQNLKSLENCRIATSYPCLLEDFLLKNNIHAEIILITGSVEIAPRISMADAICDLVATGATLEENHLEEVETIFESQAVLVKSMKKLVLEKQATYDLLVRRIHGVIQAQDSKYIMFHAPKSSISLIKNCLPGSETPTIVSLDGVIDKVAVHVVSREGVFWSTLEKLKEIGASSILVMPIEKMLS